MTPPLCAGEGLSLAKSMDHLQLPKHGKLLLDPGQLQREQMWSPPRCQGSSRSRRTSPSRDLEPLPKIASPGSEERTPTQDSVNAQVQAQELEMAHQGTRAAGQQTRVAPGHQRRVASGWPGRVAAGQQGSVFKRFVS